MSTSYLFSCTCGEHLTIRPVQAGETVNCACGAKLTAPSMREIRQLPAASASDGSLGKNTKQWQLGQGILFTTGLAIALTALGFLGHFGWKYSIAKRGVERPAIENIDRGADMMKIPLNESWKWWTMARDKSLGSRYTPSYLIFRDYAKKFMRYMSIAAVFALLGIGMSGAALFIGKSHKQ